MGMEVTGKIYSIGETKQVSERFSKREFVVELIDNPKYPQIVAFEATNDRCADLNDRKVGDEVRIEFSLRGREWRSPQGELKYFNTLSVWKVTPTSATTKTSGSAPQASSSPVALAAPADDIPFVTCDLAHEPSPIARVLR